MMTDEQKIKRGQEAEILLTSAVLNEAFKSCEDLLTNAIKNSSYGESIEREKAYFAIAGLYDVQTRLRAYLQDMQVILMDIDTQKTDLN